MAPVPHQPSWHTGSLTNLPLECTLHHKAHGLGTLGTVHTQHSLTGSPAADYHGNDPNWDRCL